MTISKENLKYVETWARENLGPRVHSFRPIDNPNPFGTSPICKTCKQDKLQCKWNQNKKSVPKIVLALVRDYRKRAQQ